MDAEAKHIYSQPVLDLVTVSTEYCRYLESAESRTEDDFLKVMGGLLPMIYLKTALLGDVPEAAGWNAHKVTEEDYEYVRRSAAATLGAHDDFLDLPAAEGGYGSGEAVVCTVSECLADVYQQLRELVEAFRQGYEDAMEAALAETCEEFGLQWGRKLLSALRALHDIRHAHGDAEY